MKRLFVTLLFILGILPAYSNVNIDKIGVINYDEVISVVFSGKSAAIKEINKEKDEMKYKLSNIKKNIMKVEELKLKAKKDNEKIAYEKKIDELKKEYADYYKLQNYQIEQKMKNVVGPMLKEIKNVVTKIAEREGYSLILDVNSDDIFYYSIDVEITQKVIDYFNDRYGEDE